MSRRAAGAANPRSRPTTFVWQGQIRNWATFMTTEACRLQPRLTSRLRCRGGRMKDPGHDASAGDRALPRAASIGRRQRPARASAPATGEPHRSRVSSNGTQVSPRRLKLILRSCQFDRMLPTLAGRSGSSGAALAVAAIWAVVLASTYALWRGCRARACSSRLSQLRVDAADKAERTRMDGKSTIVGDSVRLGTFEIGAARLPGDRDSGWPSAQASIDPVEPSAAACTKTARWARRQGS